VEKQTSHLANSKRVFEHLVDIARKLDAGTIDSFRNSRDYEGLELYILQKLMGRKD
jgi:hypothetical protein